MQRNFVAEIYRETVSFIRKTPKQRFSATLGDLGIMYAIHPQLVEKLVVDFLWVIIEHFSLDLTAEALRKNRPLLEVVGHFEDKYQIVGYV